jgi:hypothetical protein
MKDLLENLKIVDPTGEEEIVLEANVVDGKPQWMAIGTRNSKQWLQLQFTIEKVTTNPVPGSVHAKPESVRPS